VSGLSPVSIPVSHDALADRVTECVPRETGSPLPGASMPALAPGRATFGQTLAWEAGGARDFVARAVLTLAPERKPTELIERFR